MGKQRTETYLTLGLLVVSVLFAHAIITSERPAVSIQGHVATDFGVSDFSIQGNPICGINVSTIANVTYNGSFFSNVSNSSTTDGAGYGLSAGDINNDTQKDMIIGAPFNPIINVSDAGRLFVVYGEPPLRPTGNLSLISNITVNGSIQGGLVGKAVTSGDITGDRIDEVVFGEPGQNATNVNVIFGGNSMGNMHINGTNFTVNITINITSSDDVSVAVGDLNNDSIGDLIIGQPDFPDNNQSRGKVDIIFGRVAGAFGREMNTTADANASINGSTNGDAFGTAVATGDLNNDGVTDLVVGAPNRNLSNVAQVGVVYVFFGRNGFNSTGIGAANITIQGEVTINNSNNSFALTGSALFARGDVNNDTIPDLIIGAPGSTAPFNETGAGAAHVIFGRTGINGTINLTEANISLYGNLGNGSSNSSGERAGTSVFSRDYNHDGVDDIAVGAPRATFCGITDAGIVYEVHGRPIWPRSMNISLGVNRTIGGDRPNAYLGFALANGTGAVSSPDEVAFVVSGSPSILTTTSGTSTVMIYDTPQVAEVIPPRLSAGGGGRTGPSCDVVWDCGPCPGTTQTADELGFCKHIKHPHGGANYYESSCPNYHEWSVCSAAPGLLNSPSQVASGFSQSLIDQCCYEPVCEPKLTCAPECGGESENGPSATVLGTGAVYDGSSQGVCAHIKHNAAMGDHSDCENQHKVALCDQSPGIWTPGGNFPWTEQDIQDKLTECCAPPNCGNQQVDFGEDCDPPGTDCVDDQGNLMFDQTGNIIVCSNTCKCGCPLQPYTTIKRYCGVNDMVVPPLPAVYQQQTTYNVLDPPCEFDQGTRVADIWETCSPQPPKNKCWKTTPECLDPPVACNIFGQYTKHIACFPAAPSPDVAWTPFYAQNGCEAQIAFTTETLFTFGGTCSEDCQPECFLCPDMFPLTFFQTIAPLGIGIAPAGGGPSLPINMFQQYANCRCKKDSTDDGCPCPEGSIGNNWPDCACPGGTYGTPPDCTSCKENPTLPECQRCPDGWYGTPPNCIKCPKDSTDLQCMCPPGVEKAGCPCLAPSQGTYPDCYTCLPDDPRCVPEQEIPGPFLTPTDLIYFTEYSTLPQSVPVTPPPPPPPQPCVTTSNPSKTQYTQPGGDVDSDELPQGYEIITTFSTNCPQGSGVDLNINVPDNFDDIRAFLQGTEGTETVTITESTSPTCDGTPATSMISQQIAGEQNALTLDEMQTIVTQQAIITPGTTVNMEDAGYSVEIIDSVGTARTTMSMPNKDVPYPANPSIRIIGTPLLLTFDNQVSGKVKVTFPVSIPQFIDPTSIGIYAQLGTGWRQLENVEVTEGKASVTVDDIALFLTQAEDGTYQALFALMGIYCASCPGTKLEKVYDGGTLAGRHAVVLVHGITTDAQRWKFFVDDFATTQQPFQVWTFSFPLSMNPDDVGKELASQLEEHAAEFDTVDFVTHSLGGIEVQLALDYARENEYSFVNKVNNAIFAGQPGLGSPAANVYGRLFAFLLNLRSTAMLFSEDSQMLETAVDGRQVPRTPGVEYFIIAGRQPYRFTVDLFVEDGQYKPNDGIITTVSARTVGGKEITDTCEHYFEVPLTHTDLIDAWLPRRIMGRIIAQDLARQNPDRAIIGYNKLVTIGARCVPGTYIVIGKRMDEDATADPLNCNCGNGVCGEGENEINCPADCAKPLKFAYLCRLAPWLAYPLLFILLLISTMYAYRAIKKHERGYGGTILLTLTALMTLAFVAMNLLCKIPPLVGYIILAFNAALLVFTQLHLQFHKAEHITVDDSSAKELEQLLERAKGRERV